MERLAFKTVDIVERFLDSRILKWAIWVILTFSVVYFAPAIFTIINRG